MCGISAILSTDPHRLPDSLSVGRMNEAQVHRGPDASGIELFRGTKAAVGLGHRRLSIIDLAGGKQPMSNEDGTVWITYNGEIYNHMELRSELIARGHRYRTRCDTETIIHAYEEWGTDCVHHFRGMFAFVIWDDRRQRLFAARDRMGIKPLYYTFSDGNLVCASEIKAVLASGYCNPELNLEAVPQHLTLGYIAGSTTLFAGVEKLLPGHWLSWKDGELELQQYWEIPEPASTSQELTEPELVEQFLQIFQESIQLRLMSDVPLGVFLSGGLDSSAIASVMAQHMTEPVKTFSVGFEAGYYSEFDFAREVAATIGADHHEVVLKAGQMLQSLPKLIWHEDEPIRNPSSVALFEVARLARSEVKVVLTGEGSDELFAGYERYWATLFNFKWGPIYHRLAPHWLRDKYIRSKLWNWPIPLSLKKKFSHTFLNYSLSPEELVFENWHSVLPPPIHSRLLSPGMWDAVKEVNPYSDTMRLYESRSARGLLDRLLFTDQKSYLVELLRKQDKMSMAASIESRVPFLDHKMVEFAAQVPARLKVRNFSGKYLVKQAMQQLLPKKIIKRKKMGFPVPISEWFRHQTTPALRSVLAGEQARERGIFDVDYVKSLLDEHSAGMRDHSSALWSLVNFELWMRIFMDGQSRSNVADELAESVDQSPRAQVAGVA